MTPDRFRKLRRVLSARQPDLTVLMENVHKTHNIAAVLRTCDAVGVFEANAVSEEDEVPRHHMVSGGTRRYVRVRLHDSIVAACEALRTEGHQVLAAHFSDAAVDYREVDYTPPTAILMGSELWGVSEAAAAHADRHVAIPMNGMVQSLNVSVAAGLSFYLRLDGSGKPRDSTRRVGYRPTSSRRRSSSGRTRILPSGAGNGHCPTPR
jgi:tRNA (guanosine-2'-O-)-methyltransferase